MKRFMFAGLAALSFSYAASANVLYEDITYWLPGGQTLINPAVPPTNAWIKVQQTVYDDVQGRSILQALLGINAINGPAVPAVPINLYSYSITNLNYGNGPFTGVGAGVTGFNIVDGLVAPLGIWGPNAANSRWEPSAGNSAPTDYEWDIDADGDGLNGDGVGILLSQTFNSFLLAVPAGTPHGFLNAWAHTWTGGGALEQPNSLQADTVVGLVSGPVPAPGPAALLALGGLAASRRRRAE